MADATSFAQEEYPNSASITSSTMYVSQLPSQETRQSPLVSRSRFVQAYAWTATAFAFPLPNIVWINILGHTQGLPGEFYGRLLILALFSIWSMLSPRLRPVRGFLLALLIFQMGTTAKFLFATIPSITVWLNTLSPVQFLLADALEWVLFCALPMALTLIGSGLSRQDLHLSQGNMLARSRLFRPVLPAVRWPWLVSILFAILIIPFVAQLVQIVHPDPSIASHILSALPLILAFGIINGAQEEFRFRVLFLARLTPMMGSRQAILLTAILFGMAHWFGGHPNGLLGTLTVTVAGWILGLNILETKGVAWAWLIHTIADTIVAVILAMSIVYR